MLTNLFFNYCLLLCVGLSSGASVAKSAESNENVSRMPAARCLSPSDRRYILTGRGRPDSAPPAKRALTFSPNLSQRRSIIHPVCVSQVCIILNVIL